jgi:cephalosporin hydroxylase
MDGDSREFERKKREAAANMVQDADLAIRAREALVAADRHGYTYQWTWLGMPIIQMPEDVLVLQEIVWATKPDVVIETGIARGGSLIFFASLFELLGRGLVVGVDIDIREENRIAITNHSLAGRIHLIEGSSTDPAVAEEVKSAIQGDKNIMVVLDSNHTHEHVLNELRVYAPLVTVGQFLVVADTVVEHIPAQTHRPRPWGPGNNPLTALQQYLLEDRGLEADASWNNKLLWTSSPGGYLKRIMQCDRSVEK